MITDQEIANNLKVAGLKMTQARLYTFKALHELDHPSVEEIFKFCQLNGVKTSFQSIYNNLEDFGKSNLVRKMATSEGSTRYDVHLHNHCHIHHDESNNLEDYEDEGLMMLIENYIKKKQLNINIKSIDVIINATNT